VAVDASGVENGRLEFDKERQMSCRLENPLIWRWGRGRSGTGSPGWSRSRGVAVDASGVENGYLEFDET
jgi:hypothetical protein